MDSSRFFVACPGLGFRVLVRWLVVARVLRRQFRATRCLQSFVAISRSEVSDLVAIWCGLSRYHTGNLVCCDLFLLLSSSCYLSFDFFVWSLVFVLCGVFPELTVFHVFPLFGLGRHKNYFFDRLSFDSFPVIICFQLSRRGLMLHCVADSILLFFLQNVKRKSREEKRSHFASR